jgi:beta-propeller repeat-containing protein/putative Ig domain-containing protein
MRCFAKVLTASWCLFFASLLGAPTANAADGGRDSSSAKPSSAREAAVQPASDHYGDLPLSFEANQGQFDGQVRFVSRGGGYSFFLTPSGAVLSFSRDAHSDAVLRMQLAGASPSAIVEGLNPLPGKSNYFAGSDSSRWRTGVPTYSRVKYESIYPGISLVYYGNQRQLEYDFVVAPGADPRQIRLSVAGAQQLTVDAQGNLVLHNAAGEVQLLAPRVYQQIRGQKEEIAGQWTLSANNSAGFRLGAYDRTQPLVIDPVLMYSSFLGGSQKNSLNRIAIDAAGNAYVAGYTASGDFPAAPTPSATTFGAGAQSRGAFVAKIDPSGSTLLFSTYLSGTSDLDEATGLAVDKSGNVYLAGNTHSTDFPTRNALQSTCATHTSAGTCSSAFLTKISPSGDSLLFSTYFGGSGGESARGLAIDSTGNTYLAGVTSSLDLPATSGAAQTKCGGACLQNAFVAKFSPAGDKVIYATYLGGSATDDSADLAVDSSGNAYITGRTTSSDFPLAAPYQKSCTAGTTSAAGACLSTAFVTKLKADGSAFIYSTYLGGSLGSQASAIAVDSQGSAYVTGSTQSADFPVLKAFQKSCGIDGSSGNCSVDSFVTKFSPTGKALVYSTYLGGSGRDEPSGIAVDASGNAHVVGSTESADFPTMKPIQAHLKGTSDAFAVRLNATGDALSFSTYHGGTATESGNAIALDAKSNIYLTGETTSADFPTQHPFQSSCAGACTSAFITKMTVPLVNSAPTITSAASTTFTVGTAGTFTVTTTGTPTPAIDDGGATLPSPVTFTDNGDGTATLAGTPATGTGGAYPFTITASNTVLPNATQSFTLTVNESPTIVGPPTLTCTVGTACSIGMTTTGFPVPSLTVAGTLPSGITFTDNHDGTGTLGGTALAGSGGLYTTVVINASNSVGSAPAHPVNPVTINEAPSITSASSTTFTEGVAGTFTLVTKGYPKPTLSETGTLPTGVTFTAGTGVLAGTPAAGTAAGGPYAITFTAHNTTAPNATQNFTLNVNPAPALTVAKTHTGTFTQGGTGTWLINVSNTATGSTTTSGLTVTDTLPAGYTKASISGTGWSCAGTNSLTCTSTSTVAGGAAYPTLTIVVNIPSTSPNTVSNTATASGGGALANASGSDLNVTVGQVPANLVATSGANQAVPVGNNFSVFSATVTDAGMVPIQGVPVTFTAPATGANCLFSGSSTSTVNSDASGVATSTVCTANTTSGVYSVQASVTTSGVPKPTFALKNTDFSLAFAPASSDVAPGNAPSGVTITATALSGYAPTSLTGTSCVVTSGPTPTPTCVFTTPITVGTAAPVSFVTTGSPAGIYTVQATYHDSSTVPVSHTATFTLHLVQVTISTTPPATVEVNQTVPFAGSTAGLADTNVNWSVVPTVCSGAACGTFSASGPNTSTNYLSPASTGTGVAVAIKATSDGDATFSATTSPSTLITDYSVALPGATVVIGQANPGATGSSTLAATAINGYVGTINAAVCSVLPATTLGPAPTCSATAPAVPGSSAVGIITQANSPTGLYNISVQATDSASTPQSRTTGAQPIAIDCAFSLGSSSSFLPVFNPATTTNTTNSYSFGVTETAGGSNCAWGNKPVVGITIPASSVDGVVVLSTDTQGDVLTSVNGFSKVTLTVSTPTQAAQTGSVTVPFFDPTATGDSGSLPLPVGLEASVPISAVQGGTIAPFALPVTVAAAGTLNVPNINLTGVTSVCGAVNSTGTDPNNLNFGITCSATVSAGSVQLAVTLPAASAAALRSHDRTPTMLLALGLGFPAIVFLSVGASAFAPRQRKRGMNRITCILGIFLLVSLLVVLPACGGGFHANFITPNNNTYTLTVMGYVTDGSNNVIGLDVFTVLLTVN